MTYYSISTKYLSYKSYACIMYLEKLKKREELLPRIKGGHQKTHFKKVKIL